eukprot:scaffold133_cov257-Pinguiococcus_pyrenoidosus.AAC.26
MEWRPGAVRERREVDAGGIFPALQLSDVFHVDAFREVVQLPRESAQELNRRVLRALEAWKDSVGEEVRRGRISRAPKSQITDSRRDGGRWLRLGSRAANDARPTASTSSLRSAAVEGQEYRSSWERDRAVLRCPRPPGGVPSGEGPIARRQDLSGVSGQVSILSSVGQ